MSTSVCSLLLRLGAVWAITTGAITDATAETQALDEDAYITRWRAESPRLAVAPYTAAASEARIAEAGVRPNPGLELSHEALAGTRESWLRATVPIDVTGRRGLAREAASLQHRAVLAELGHDRWTAEIDRRRLFADARAARDQRALIAAQLTTIEALAAQLDARAKAGDVAIYEAERVALERELVAAELADAELLERRLGHALGAELGLPTLQIVPADEIATPSLPTPVGAEPRADVRAATALADAAGAEARAASRVWGDLEIGAGISVATGDDTHLGYGLVVRGQVPLFNRGGATRVRATQDAARWRSEAQARQREATAAVAGATDAVTRARAQHTAFRDGPARRAAVLITSVTIAYREGERGIVELLDALRTSRAVASRERALAAAAHTHYLDLLLAHGGPAQESIP